MCNRMEQACNHQRKFYFIDIITSGLGLETFDHVRRKLIEWPGNGRFTRALQV